MIILICSYYTHQLVVERLNLPISFEQQLSAVLLRLSIPAGILSKLMPL